MSLTHVMNRSDITAGNTVHSILDAALALTTLGNEEEEMGCNEQETQKVQLPQQEAHKTKVHTSGRKDEASDEHDYSAKIFPQRLFDVLSDERNADCICWLPHGRGFIVRNREKFTAEVLPRYFKQTKFNSFTRRLNRWNFTRITTGPEHGAYTHKFFQRGNPTLCTQMYCKNERAKFAKTLTSVEQKLRQVPERQSSNYQKMPTEHPLSVQVPKFRPALSQQTRMLLAASRMQKLRTHPGVDSPTTAAIIDAAKRALHRSNVLSVAHKYPATRPSPPLPRISPVTSLLLARLQSGELSQRKESLSPFRASAA